MSVLKYAGVGGGIVLLAGVITLGVLLSNNRSVKDEPQSALLTSSQQVVSRVLERMPIIDGHNDFPWNLRNIVFNDLSKVDFSSNLSEIEPWASSPYSHTDIPRLRAGKVGAQFWVAYTSCASQYKDSVEQTIEQIDVIKRLALKYKDHLHFSTSANDIEEAIKNNKIGSLIGVEGGHSIQSSFGILRLIYDLGVRYMTLTHSCNTPWADSSPMDGSNPPNTTSNGLSTFGLQVIEEMNRLGMMVDLSHVSYATMSAALNHTKAPVIFSHSSAYALCEHDRNVRDDILLKVKETNSLVMVNFYPNFIACGNSATLDDVKNHIEYIRNITGPDHVGIGGDYDGVGRVPIGLEDVSKYPNLFEALWETGRWTEEDLEKLAGRNLLRVFRDVEKVRDELSSTDMHEETLSRSDFEEKGANLNCITAKLPGDKIKEESKRKRSISDDFLEL